MREEKELILTVRPARYYPYVNFIFSEGNDEDGFTDVLTCNFSECTPEKLVKACRYYINDTKTPVHKYFQALDGRGNFYIDAERVEMSFDDICEVLLKPSEASLKEAENMYVPSWPKAEEIK